MFIFVVGVWEAYTVCPGELEAFNYRCSRCGCDKKSCVADKSTWFMCKTFDISARLMYVYCVEEIDQALEEYNAMELLQAQEMVRRTARGETAMHESLEWRGLQYVLAKRSKSVGYWGDHDSYVRGSSGGNFW